MLSIANALLFIAFIASLLHCPRRCARLNDPYVFCDVVSLLAKLPTQESLIDDERFNASPSGKYGVYFTHIVATWL